MIYCTELIRSDDADKFEENLNNAIESLQNDGLRIEIQGFSMTAWPSTYEYVALVVAYREI
jgi:hypothetical protein